MAIIKQEELNLINKISSIINCKIDKIYDFQFKVEFNNLNFIFKKYENGFTCSYIDIDGNNQSESDKMDFNPIIKIFKKWVNSIEKDNLNVNSDIPLGIDKISPMFRKIYNQSQIAENNKLNEICGMGYRKAFEFLLKDLLKIEHPNDVSNIDGSFRLGDLIKNYTSDNLNLNKLLMVCADLGNDECHYINKHQLPIDELKKSITLLITIIEENHRKNAKITSAYTDLKAIAKKMNR